MPKRGFASFRFLSPLSIPRQASSSVMMYGHYLPCHFYHDRLTFPGNIDDRVDMPRPSALLPSIHVTPTIAIQGIFFILRRRTIFGSRWQRGACGSVRAAVPLIAGRGHRHFPSQDYPVSLPHDECSGKLIIDIQVFLFLRQFLEDKRFPPLSI